MNKHKIFNLLLFMLDSYKHETEKSHEFLYILNIFWQVGNKRCAISCKNVTFVYLSHTHMCVFMSRSSSFLPPDSIAHVCKLKHSKIIMLQPLCVCLCVCQQPKKQFYYKIQCIWGRVLGVR